MDKRNRLAWAALVSATVLLAMLATTPLDQIASHRVLGFVFKLTLTIAALWLAWPDLVRLGQRLPPKFGLVAAISLLALLVQPRFGALLIAATMAYWGGWWAYRKLNLGRRRP